MMNGQETAAMETREAVRNISNDNLRSKVFPGSDKEQNIKNVSTSY